MGCLCSRESESSSSGAVAGSHFNFSSSEFDSELKAYSMACREDASLSLFDSHLQASASNVINGLVANGNSTGGSVTEVSSFVLEMNEQVVNVILDCQNDIWNDKHLFDLVEQYFQNTSEILDFCSGLTRILGRAQNSLNWLFGALQTLEEEKGPRNYNNLLTELKSFMAVSDGFAEDYSGMCRHLYFQQVEMLNKLRIKQEKLATKVKYAKVFRKISSVIFVGTLMVVFLWSVVALTFVAPPLLIGLSEVANALPLETMGSWIESLLDNFENVRRERGVIVTTTASQTVVMIGGLKHLTFEMKTVRDVLEIMQGNANRMSVNISTEALRAQLEDFQTKLNKMGEEASKYKNTVVSAREAVMKKITESTTSFYLGVG